MKNRSGGLLRIGGLILLAIVLVLALSSNALSDSLLHQPPPPREIRLDTGDDGRQIELSEGQVLVIGLEGNPSTGYLWRVEKGAEGTLRERGEFEFQPESNLLGAPGIQTLRFEAVRAGQSTLRLIYHRPWEEDVEPARTFSLQVQSVGSFAHASSAAAPTYTATQAAPDVESYELVNDQGLGLPSSYNWCDWGGCSPVKNQGGCGSCWAFSTVGPLESNILIHDGVAKDLSEQYLVSCNTDGWDCVDGGWFAHDYHEWKVPPDEPEAGAVYETDFPYSASDAPCNPPHPHQERIASWEYVDPMNPSSVASVAAIKQAIYEHGPVSAAVCVNSAFQYYSGDIFEGPGCTDINHGIVLVGWDDNQGVDGVWYLRNSWGAYWGEGGYMRIGYGVSSVGYAANYVVLSPNCYTLSMSVSPSGSGSIDADPSPDCGLDGYEPASLSEVELTATARPGWDFTGWTGDVSGIGNPTTITMDSDKTVTAHFICDACLPRAYLPLAMKDY